MRPFPLDARALPLAFGLAFAGCATKPPEVSQGAPTVVAIYGVDGARTNLGRFVSAEPEVQLYRQADPGSSDPHLANPATSPLPPLYTSLRVEFDQPMAGNTLAGDNALGNAAGGASASYCDPAGANGSIQLVDVGASPANQVIKSSICYDATSAVGQNPHVLIVPGAGAAGPAENADPSPFTCQAFAAFGSPDGNGSFPAGHAYAVRFAPASVQSAQGAPLTLPADSNAAAGWSWSGNQFNFKTAAFDVMAAGFQSSVNTYFYWQEKPFAGFEPNRDAQPDGAGQTCAAGVDATVPCRIPADGTPYFIVLSRALLPSRVNNGTVKLTRANGTVPDFTATASSAGTAIHFPFGESAKAGRNVVVIAPGTSWEPGQQYVVTLTTGLQAADGTPLPAASATAYPFTAAAAALAPPRTDPPAGQVGVGILPTLSVTFQVPVDPAKVDSVHYRLLDASGAAVATTAPAVTPGSNSQVVTFTPLANLTPEATYTLQVTGQTIGAGAASAGSQLPDLSPGSSFTVAPFGLVAIDSASLGTEVDGNGAVDPAALFDNSTFAQFTDAAGNVSATTVTLAEAGSSTPLALAVTADAVNSMAFYDAWDLQVSDPTYPMKFKQAYTVNFSTAIQDQGSPGKTLKAVPCNGADCSDARGFTTFAYAPRVSGPDAATGAFKLTFPYPFVPGTVNLADASAGGAFFLYPQAPGGGVDKTKAVPVTCNIVPPSATVAANTQVACAANGPLQKNTRYLGGGTFGTATSPAVKVAPTVTLSTTPPLVVNTDQASGTFTGSASGSVLTGC